jgi:hypothetical protein
MGSLLTSWAQWLETSPWGNPVRHSLWLYPFIQLIHFGGLSLWIGTSLAVDLRLIGWGRRRQTAAQLSQQLFAWNWIGFAIMLLGGFLLFSGIATSLLVNAAFVVKLSYLVPAALAWHIIIQRKTHTWGRTENSPAVAKLAAVVELLLWLSVVTAAVLIPNY